MNRLPRHADTLYRREQLRRALAFEAAKERAQRELADSCRMVEAEYERTMVAAAMRAAEKGAR